MAVEEARRTFHQPRLRRESYGELVQIDGSEHRWFENRGEPCTLLVFVSDMAAGNDFLPACMQRFNERFAVRAAKAEDLHRPLHVPQQKLNDILCHREQRYIGAQLSFRLILLLAAIGVIWILLTIRVRYVSQRIRERLEERTVSVCGSLVSCTIPFCKAFRHLFCAFT